MERLYQESGAQFGAIHTAGDEYHMKRGNNLLLELHWENVQGSSVVNKDEANAARAKRTDAKKPLFLY